MVWRGIRLLLLIASRVILIGGGFAALIAAWAYYGYRRIGCHPMFSGSTGVECGSVQALAAEHALAIVRTLAPYQQTLRDNQAELVAWAGAVLGAAIAVELIFGFSAVLRHRRARRDMFKGTTGV